ncbi:hypothetical protein NYZ99_11060 [Maribacter litopenaei]|uniref:Uncharacterized protein n=1 Tax=Maribacter litopenaei TaxID=2976127 RepID=A0ABY5Y3W9_9FLAO|nr:hypothetical protein [Maribacter litopenaei]UWX53696.1 hypothetical protein NYZ99_11060 [Maribacter litopenaei]
MKGKKTNKNPFTTPKGYFDSFEDNLLDKINKETSGIPKKEGFNVPESYFDRFQENIMTKIREEESTPKVIQFLPIYKFVAIAASFAAMVVLVISIDWNPAENLNFNDLANSDIEAYFEDNELDLSSDEIAEVLPLEGYEINDFLEPQMTEENLLDYLNENVESFEELNLEDNE